MPSGYDVVIGFHESDYEFVEKLSDKLTSSGMSVWFKKPSDDAKMISEAILGCKIYLPVMTEMSAVDKSIQEQLSLAYISNSAIYPLSKIRFRYLSPKLNGGAKLMLAKINWCFVFDMDEFESKTDALITCLKKDLANISLDTDRNEGAPDLNLRMSHGLELGGDGSSFDGFDGNIHLEDISTNKSFWDRHFSGRDQVPWSQFRSKFLEDYSSKIDEAFPENKHERKKVMVNLIYKDIFGMKKSIPKSDFDKFSVETAPHAFFTRLQEYLIAYMSLREVLDMDSSLRITTIQSLGKFSFPAIVSGLSDMLKDEDPNVRSVAAIALAHAGQHREDTVDKLVAIIEDEDRLVRESACLSLGYLRSTRAVSYIVDRWRNDPISHVREAAELALSKLEVEDAQKCMKVTKVLSSEMNALKPQTAQ